MKALDEYNVMVLLVLQLKRVFLPFFKLDLEALKWKAVIEQYIQDRENQVKSHLHGTWQLCGQCFLIHAQWEFWQTPATAQAGHSS